jgi:hypothetical protein
MVVPGGWVVPGSVASDGEDVEAVASAPTSPSVVAFVHATASVRATAALATTLSPGRWWALSPPRDLFIPEETCSSERASQGVDVRAAAARERGRAWLRSSTVAGMMPG